MHADETVRTALIHLGRFGNVVQMRSSLNRIGAERLRAALATSEPAARATIDAHIDSLIELMREYDPLDLIAPVSLSKGFMSVPSFDGGKDRDPVTDVEHLVNLATALPFPLNAQRPPSTIIQRVFDTLAALRIDLMNYYLIRSVPLREGAAVDEEERLCFTARLQALLVRGDDYEHIAREVFLGMFGATTQFMRTHYGFDATDLLGFYDLAEAQIEDRGRRFHSRFRATYDHLSREIRIAQPEGEEVFRTAGCGILPNPTKEIFEVVPATEKHHRICESLSLVFEENTQFLTGVPNWRGWPLNPSATEHKPLICHEGRFYLPNPAFMCRSLRTIMASLIEGADPEYHATKFLPMRSEYLMSRTRQLLESWFGESHVFANAYYQPHDAASRCEADILVVRDDVILLVECKAGHVAPAAKRGAAKRLMANLTRIVTDAHQQSLRTLDFILRSPHAQFTNAKGEALCEVVTGRLEHIFLIDVIFEHLGYLVCNTPLLERLKLIDGRALPWVVTLGDLIAINEILDSPSQFLHYLVRRMRAAQRQELEVGDELDLMMVYLHQGLWLDDWRPKAGETLHIGNWTSELDRYFLGKQLGTRPDKPQLDSVVKPKTKLPEGVTRLIAALEHSMAGPSLSCAIALLDLDAESLTQMECGLNEMARRVASDGERHTLTLSSRGAGCDIVCSEGLEPLGADEAAFHARFRFAKGSRKVYVVAWTGGPLHAKLSAWVFTR